MRETILVIDDEADVVDLVRYHLIRAGFEVDFASTGMDGLDAARQRRPDAIVLDIMLPQMSGTEVLRRLRMEIDTARIPVLMLTAKALLSERLAGLELGVDDYITKPFSPRELVLRIQNLLRRIRDTQMSSILEVDGFSLNKSNFEITVQGRRLDLTTTEFKLLATLVERRGRTLSREMLLQDVWGYENAIETRTVDTHVRRLREKLGRAATRIVTVRGEGYRFLPQEPS
jgi:DNA-binding response OmpR family regulator